MDLRELRSKKGLSQQLVADKSGISTSLYCMVENGKRRPSVETAKKIAATLGFDWTRFFQDKDKEV